MKSLEICWAIGSCSPDQQFQMSSANTAQTVGEFSSCKGTRDVILCLEIDVIDLTGV